MSSQLLLNLFIAFLWMLLNDSWSGSAFMVGYLVGLGLIFMMRRFLPDSLYVKRAWALVKLLGLFTKELFFSSILVIRQVLSPRMDFSPGIFSLRTSLQGDWEITLLSLLITLTPGSVVMEIGEDGRCLYIHAMDIPEGQRTLVKTIYAFEKAIMEVTQDV
ncbi:MAG: Na+/H+ antiporter subunit E [Syntrophomonadaceae bacterium]|nr:Na+/H+ antiporter subunit E [Syntrophomonadaceae bacterium]